MKGQSTQVLILLILLFSCEREKGNNSLLKEAEIPYLKGESVTVIVPKPGNVFDETEWYTNDHCFVVDQDNNLHWFGINNPYPPEGKRLYRYHPYLGHLLTTNPSKDWQRQPFTLNESKGTEYVGAPYVIWHEESNRWVMVVQTFFETKFGLEVCWSDNLYNWERTQKPILDGILWSSSRDPQIIKGDDGKYWIHLVSSGVGNRQNSQIIRIKTKDFQFFEMPLVIMEIEGVRTAVESPFLIEKNNLWYLLCTYAHRRYEETIVVVSDNPNHFNYKKHCLTTLFGHASEIFTYNGRTYISSCGPEDRQSLNLHGVTLAEIAWLKQTKR